MMKIQYQLHVPFKATLVLLSHQLQIFSRCLPYFFQGKLLQKLSRSYQLESTYCPELIQYTYCQAQAQLEGELALFSLYMQYGLGYVQYGLGYMQYVLGYWGRRQV